MSNLPQDWKLCRLGDVIRLKNGFAFKSSDYSTDGIPLVRISDIQDGKVELEKSVKIPESKVNPDFFVCPGDLLIAMSGATTGKTGVYSGTFPCLQNQRVGNFKIISDDVLDTKYRNYYVESLQKKIEAAAYGGAQPNISAKGIEAFPFPLAPLEQQKRIVAEIEKQFSRLDEAVANLKRVKANLKHYKAAVLKAAVEGKLTEEWRKQHPDVEPANKLLERMVAERRANWQGRGKYKEPAAPETTDIPELPEGWVLASLEQITSGVRVICYGILMPKANLPDGIPYVKVKDMKGDKIDLHALHRTSPEIASKYERASLRAGDILLSIRGTYGRVAEVPEELEGGNITQDTARIDVLPPVNRDFIALQLRAPGLQTYFKRVARGVAVKGVNIGDVRPAPILMPPVIEQEEIVEMTSRALSVIDEVEAETEINLRRAERLRQSVLKKAFSGRLS